MSRSASSSALCSSCPRVANSSASPLPSQLCLVSQPTNPKVPPSSPNETKPASLSHRLARSPSSPRLCSRSLTSPVSPQDGAMLLQINLAHLSSTSVPCSRISESQVLVILGTLVMHLTYFYTVGII